MASVLLRKSLQKMWMGGREGDLCAKEQLKALCYREIMQDLQVAIHGMITNIARKLQNNGGGQPTCEALRKIFHRVDEDPEWFPGKSYQARCAPCHTQPQAPSICFRQPRKRAGGNFNHHSCRTESVRQGLVVENVNGANPA